MKDQMNLIDERVLVRSNEDEPVKVGTVVGWQECANSKFPLVKYDGEDKEYICFSVLFPYSVKLHEFLDSLSATEGWQLAHDFSLVTQVRHRKESSQR